MLQVCSARGIRYVHALQPTLHDRGSKPVTEREFKLGIGEEGYDESVVNGYPMLREGLLRLAGIGVETLDLSFAFASVEESLYKDSCHFVTQGKRIIGELIADQVLAAPAAEDH